MRLHRFLTAGLLTLALLSISVLVVIGCDRLLGPPAAAARAAEQAVTTRPSSQPGTSAVQRPAPLAPIVQTLTPLPRPADPSLNGLYDSLNLLGEVVDALRAVRLEADDAAAVAFQTSAITKRLAGIKAEREDDARNAAVQQAIDRVSRGQGDSDVALLTLRAGVYLGESATQLQLLKSERPAVYAKVMDAIRGADPQFEPMLPTLVVPSSDSRERFAESQCQTLRSQIELYKLQHVGDLDFRQGWRQLTNKTDANGIVQDASSGRYGPYLKSEPINPFTNGSRVRVIDGIELRSDGHVGSDYVYHLPTGRFYTVLRDGTLMGAEPGVLWSKADEERSMRAAADMRARPSSSRRSPAR